MDLIFFWKLSQEMLYTLHLKKLTIYYYVLNITLLLRSVVSLYIYLIKHILSISCVVVLCCLLWKTKKVISIKQCRDIYNYYPILAFSSLNLMHWLHFFFSLYLLSSLSTHPLWLISKVFFIYNSKKYY